MLPPQRATQPVTPSSAAASTSGASNVTRCRSVVSSSADSDKRVDGDLYPGAGERLGHRRCQRSARLVGLVRVVGLQPDLRAQQQPAVHPDLFDVVDRHAACAPARRTDAAAMPGASWPLTVTRNDDGATSDALTTR